MSWLGDLFKGVDSFANSINPMRQPTEWLANNTLGQMGSMGKAATQLGNFGTDHPLESILTYLSMGGGFGAGASGAMSGMFGGAGAAGTSATAMGPAAGELGAVDSEAASSMLGYGAADVAGGGGGAAAGGGGGLASMFQGLGGKMGGGKNIYGMGQLLSSLYGLQQSNQLRKQAGPPNPADLQKMPGYQAGLDAVQRSMASQGYQGSGNMMAALQKYGGDAYSQMWQGNIASSQAAMGGLGGELSSLGLLTAGLGNLAGWGGGGHG